MREAGKDTLFIEKLDSICMGLNAIFPDQSAEEFHRNLMEGYEKNKAHWPIWKRRVNYSTYSEVKKLPEVVCRGGSCVIDPYGHYVMEPLWDQEGILYADLDMEQVPASRMEFDPCGHYARPDVLKLEVNE